MNEQIIQNNINETKNVDNIFIKEKRKTTNGQFCALQQTKKL